jgi:gamma-glutamyl-gamma-aminobutyrate hydrolase PuuD
LIPRSVVIRGTTEDSFMMMWDDEFSKWFSSKNDTDVLLTSLEDDNKIEEDVDMVTSVVVGGVSDVDEMIISSNDENDDVVFIDEDINSDDDTVIVLSIMMEL